MRRQSQVGEDLVSFEIDEKVIVRRFQSLGKAADTDLL
ncbi:hypothetical protein SAMN05216338_103518 [Bradyrhizobium sp. Rc2d]|nr:hypothetical protein SAMN05216338_103518 [Bradyrhizobium sp. Rc2d]